MTVFGIYLIALNVFGIMMNFYYAGQGGIEYTPGVLILAAIWSILNVLGIIFLGTGSI